MGIDSWDDPPSPPTTLLSQTRRLSLTPARMRLKEERKKIVRSLEEKYRNIDDHERGMRKFVLIRNNLRRLQREAREEKMSKYRFDSPLSCKFSNLSPSCLSSHRPLTPPPSRLNTPALSSTILDDEGPLPKRQKLFFDSEDDSEMDCDPTSPPRCQTNDDAREILRDLQYETCPSDDISDNKSYATSSIPDSNHSHPVNGDLYCSGLPEESNKNYSSYTDSPNLSLPAPTCFSVSMSAACSMASTTNNLHSSDSNNSETEWQRAYGNSCFYNRFYRPDFYSSCASYNNSCSYINNSNSSCNNSSNSNSSEQSWHSMHSQTPFNCGKSSLLGNDLQSVVFHSLITSLES